jgi:DNA-directed RNA polymerase subunit RPC12/RpoP
MTLRCSFCGREESPIRKLVAGPSVFICADCARLASRVLTEADSGGKVSCAICGTASSPETFLTFQGQGYLCANCIRSVLAATKAGADDKNAP